MNLETYPESALPVKQLKGTDPVEMLDLSWKGLGMASAFVIASLIGVNGGALTKISLACNCLGEDGTKAICEALKVNKTLKELDMSGGRESNIGGSAGAQHVASMLAVNGVLTSLNVLNNNLDTKGKSAIRKAVKSRKGFDLKMAL